MNCSLVANLNLRTSFLIGIDTPQNPMIRRNSIGHKEIGEVRRKENNPTQPINKHSPRSV